MILWLGAGAQSREERAVRMQQVFMGQLKFVSSSSNIVHRDQPSIPLRHAGCEPCRIPQITSAFHRRSIMLKSLEISEPFFSSSLQRGASRAAGRGACSPISTVPSHWVRQTPRLARIYIAEHVGQRHDRFVCQCRCKLWLHCSAAPLLAIPAIYSPVT